MKTKLEELALNHPEYQALSQEATRKERQKALDSITENVIRQLTPQEISDHVRTVYNDTIGEYAGNSHNHGIIDELVDFMTIIPQGGSVLDMGCGTGRDVLFMACDDREFRTSLMQRESGGKKTIEKRDIPGKTFRVTGIDGSEAMIWKAQEWLGDLKSDNKAFAYTPVFSHCPDMHYFKSNLQWRLDGIWSCAALFTHTPKILVRGVLKSIADAIKRDGHFFTSYTRCGPEGKYDKILLSSTGRLKYFSHPDPKEIAAIAENYGLKLERENFSDFEVNGKVVQKDLFVSQFFKKV